MAAAERSAYSSEGLELYKRPLNIIVDNTRRGTQRYGILNSFVLQSTWFYKAVCIDESSALGLACRSFLGKKMLLLPLPVIRHPLNGSARLLGCPRSLAAWRELRSEITCREPTTHTLATARVVGILCRTPPEPGPTFAFCFWVSELQSISLGPASKPRWLSVSTTTHRQFAEGTRLLFALRSWSYPVELERNTLEVKKKL